MLSNLKVFPGPTMDLPCKSQRLSMPRAEFSNVCHTQVQITLWWLKIWAGENQRVIAKEWEGILWSPGGYPGAKPFQIGWKAPCSQSEVSFKVSRDIRVRCPVKSPLCPAHWLVRQLWYPSGCGLAYPLVWASCHSHLLPYSEQGLRNSRSGSTHLWNDKWWGRKKKDLLRVNLEWIHGGIYLLLQTWKKSTQTTWSREEALTRCVFWRQGDRFACCYIVSFSLSSLTW